MTRSQQEPQAPVKEYRAGHVAAACWETNFEENGRVTTRRAVKIQNRYQDKQTGEWHSTEYYYPSELVDLILVALHALTFVRVRESESGSDFPVVAR